MYKQIIVGAMVLCCRAASAQVPKTNASANKTAKITPTQSRILKPKLVQVQSTLTRLQATLQQANKLMQDLKDEKDGLGDMSQQDMIQLQQLMEKKGQLEQLLSNLMKAMQETQENIIKNMK